MADQTNPYTQLGMMGMMMPNPYTQYGGKPLPIPGYMGTPTDAQGNPIASFGQAQQQHDAWNAANPAPAAPAAGTTLTSNPLGGSPWSPGGYGLGMNGANPQIARPGDPGSGGAPYFPQASPPWPGQMQQAPAAAAPAASQNPVDMRQAYLTALSNPGKVTTPGANVPQAQPLGTPSVMNAFLAANPSGGGAGAGGYNNQGFFSTLNKLRAS